MKKVKCSFIWLLISFLLLPYPHAFAQNVHEVEMQIISNDFLTIPQQLDLTEGRLWFSGIVNREGRHAMKIFDPLNLKEERSLHALNGSGYYTQIESDQLVTFALHISSDVYEPILNYNLLDNSNLQLLEKDQLRLKDEVSVWCGLTFQYPYFRSLDTSTQGRNFCILTIPLC